MKSLMTLFKREYWEYNRSILWLPIIISTALILVGLIGIFQAQENEIKLGKPIVVFFDSFTFAIFPVLLFTLLPLVMNFYLLNSLYEERNNKSIFFWRSMPISDRKVVMSKVIFGVVIIPLIFISLWGAVMIIDLFCDLVFGDPAVAITSGEATKLSTMKSKVSFFLAVSLGNLAFCIVCLPYFAYCLFASSVSNRSPWLIAVLPFLILFLLNVIFKETAIIYDYIAIPFEHAIKALAVVMSQFYNPLAPSNEFSGLLNFIFNKYIGLSESLVDSSISVNSLLVLEYDWQDIIELALCFAVGIGFVILAIQARKRVHSI